MDDSMSHGKTARPLLLGLVLAGTMVAAPSAGAVPMNVTAVRSVEVGDFGHGAFLGSRSPSTSIGDFKDDVEADVGGTHPYPGYPDFTTNEKAVAEQHSFIEPASDFVAGRGNVGISFSVVDADLAYARSSIDVWFDLSGAHSYSLTGLLEANMDGGLGLASVSLQGPTTFAFDRQGWGSLNLADSGTLAPGSYHLSIFTLIQPQCEPSECSAYSFMGGSSSFDVALRVTAVPEPGTCALLLAGLGGLGFAARRQRTAAR